MSVVGGMLPEFRRQLAALKTVQATVTPVAPNSASTLAFACHYEKVTPKTGGALDYETPGGYGYNVYPKESDAPVALEAGDVITVDGIRIEVQEYGPQGNLSGGRVAWCTKRG